MRTIKLHASGLGRYDDVSPFIIADRSLELKIELPNYNGEFYLISENNGVKTKTQLGRDGTVQLNSLTAGELNCEIKHYVKGELVKTYKAEPLILKELDARLAAEPEFALLKREMSELNKTLAEYREKTDRQIKTLEQNLCAVLKIIRADAEKNPFTDNLDIEEFIAAYGLELNEEQLKSIRGENENEEN